MSYRCVLGAVAASIVACGPGLPLTGDAGPNDAASVDVGVADAADDVASVDAPTDAPADAPPPYVNPKVQALATGQNDPVALAIDSNAYWSTLGNGGQIWSCPTTGCTTPTLLASNQPNVTQLVTTGQALFWVANGNLMTCATSGCGQSPSVFASNVVSSAVAARPTAVDFATSAGLVQCPTAGCGGAPTTLVAGGTYNGLDNLSLVYFTGGDAVGSCPPSGCASPSLVASNQIGAQTIWNDGENIFWTNVTAGTIGWCSASSCSPATLVGQQSMPWGIKSYGTAVYWSNAGDGTIQTCALASCTTPTLIAAGQGTPKAIGVDMAAIYWLNNVKGEVERLPLQ